MFLLQEQQRHHQRTKPMPANAIDAVRPPASRLITTRTRKAKISEQSNEEMTLIQWWSRKRLPEIARRQHESAKCNALPSEGDKDKAYVRFLMRELVRELPPAGVAKLLEYIKGFNSTLVKDIGAFAEQVKELVDEYDVKVMLHFPPRCTVRVTRSRPVCGSADGHLQANSATTLVPPLLRRSDKRFRRGSELPQCGSAARAHSGLGPQRIRLENRLQQSEKRLSHIRTSTVVTCTTRAPLLASLHQKSGSVRHAGVLPSYASWFEVLCVCVWVCVCVCVCLHICR